MSPRLWASALLLCACTPDKPGPSDDDSPGHETGIDTGTDVPPCADEAPTFQAVVDFMTEELEANGVPGGSIAVICGGELAFSAGIGLRKAGGSEPVTTRTRFQLASITKMFTAATAMTLKDDGLISLDAPISDVLPAINSQAPYDTPASLHHLLSHTAGVATQFPDSDFSSLDLAPFFENNRDQPLWSEPGAVFNYSNLGMALAGLTLETAADKPFGDLVEERVFQPAGMTRATMSVDTVLGDDDYAHGHSGSPATVLGPRDSYYHTGYYGPMGGAWSSAEDLARWAEVHFSEGGEVMEAESMALIRTPHTPTGRAPTQHQGYAVFMDTLYGTEVYSHNGLVGGFFADFQMVTETGFAVAVALNADWYWPGYITEHALDAFGARGEPRPELYTWDPSRFSDLVGTYEDPNVYGTIIVSQTASTLQAEFVDLGFVSTLDPSFESTFTFLDEDMGRQISMVFWREAEDGPAQHLVTLRGVAMRAEAR